MNTFNNNNSNRKIEKSIQFNMSNMNFNREKLSAMHVISNFNSNENVMSL